MTTPDLENEYLGAYFEAWSQTDEYKRMNKTEIKKHLEQAIQEYRIIMARLWGWVDGAKALGLNTERHERMLKGNNTRH